MLRAMKDLLNYAANDIRTHDYEVQGSLASYKARNEEMKSQNIYLDERYAMMHDRHRKEREMKMLEYETAKQQKYLEWKAKKTAGSLNEYVSIAPSPVLTSEAAKVSKQIYTKYV